MNGCRRFTQHRPLTRMGPKNVAASNIEGASGLGADVGAAKRIGAQYAASGHIVFIVNTDRFFLTHRSSWAVAMKTAGAKVTLIAEDTGYSQRVRELGIDFVRVPFGRESINPRKALSAASTVFTFLLKSRPRTVFMVATAAYTLGWPAALILKRTQFVRIIAGAGRALAGESPSLASSGVRAALRATSKLSNVSTIFQTPSDAARFSAAGWAKDSTSAIIPGTGIDVDAWSPSERGRSSGDEVVALFASRLFREKGIYEFIELAKRFRNSRARFVVVGRPDTGVESSVSRADLDEWIAAGDIEYLGEIDDMISVYRAADVFVFPSQHPEGTPRVLIEAAACGLAILASDQPGCRAIVRDGGTGRLFNPKDLDSLTEVFESVLSDDENRELMAGAARALVVDQYSLERTLESVHDFIGIFKIRVASPSGIRDKSA